ncbi:uncharacterized protein [Nicotiana sylvestris]|uniref:uncharacterized protein n=1 Tax=Nicotiana sylvestris TaxID=4096 RepID=UPI00388C7740
MSNNNDNIKGNQQLQGNLQGNQTPVPSPRGSPWRSREGSPHGSHTNGNTHFENLEAIDEALQKLIVAQVNKALKAFASQLPAAPSTPTPNNNTLENPRSGLVNSGSGGTPNESQEGEPAWYFLVSLLGFGLLVLGVISAGCCSAFCCGVAVLYTTAAADLPFFFFFYSRFQKTKALFQCHPIAVVTAYPLRNILHKYELSDRLAKWDIELSEYDITYQPRTAINSQVLADFVVDFRQGMFTTGTRTGINRIIIKRDSKLVVNQMMRTYTAREARMQQYLENVRDFIKQFQTWKVTQIPRDENVEADTLDNLASAEDISSNESASVIHLFHSVLDLDKNEVNFNNLTWDWRNEIIAFLQYGTIREDKKKLMRFKRKAARYCLKQGNLYRKIFGGTLARCLGPSQTEYVMREIHEGHCGNHAGGRSLIKRITSTPYHPVGNGQAESTNKVVINNLNKRLEESKGNWPEVLPGILWAYRTTAKTSTGEIPFSLVYGAEALIPVEIGELNTRFIQEIEESNDEEMRVNLDLLEGRREVALIRMTAQKQVIERYFNRKARLRFFKIGDFVLKKVFQSTKTANSGKLSPTWEGPYRIHDIAGKGAYELEIMNGKILPSHWNVVHLKRYYF